MDIDCYSWLALCLERSSDCTHHERTFIVHARKALLNRVNAESDSEYTTIKEIIVCLEPVERRRLNSQRRGILEKSATAQANLVHNQAVLFYTYDFHRKYLAGVLQTDVDSHSYDSGGQSQDVPPGNIYGKTC